MAFLEQEDVKLVGDHFTRHLKGPVTIDYFTQRESPLAIPGQECMFCRETRQLLEEVAVLSPQITLNVHDLVAEKETAARLGVDRIPAIVLSGAAKGRVRYLGIPSGYEFGGLIEDIVDVSRGSTDLSDKTRAALAGLTRPVHIQVYVTPT
jgi:alkyl hydroperoxide reductase subunit AhpF